MSPVFDGVEVQGFDMLCLLHGHSWSRTGNSEITRCIRRANSTNVRKSCVWVMSVCWFYLAALVKKGGTVKFTV